MSKSYVYIYVTYTALCKYKDANENIMQLLLSMLLLVTFCILPPSSILMTGGAATGTPLSYFAACTCSSQVINYQGRMSGSVHLDYYIDLLLIYLSRLILFAYHE